MKINRSLIVALLCGCGLSIAIYFVLRIYGADDSGFYASFVIASIVVATVVSPGRDIMAGLRRIWLFDFVTAVFMPIIFLLLMAPSESLPIIVARYISYLVFILSGLIIVRRFLGGRPS